MGEWDSVENIVRFGLSALGILIHQHNLAADATHDQSISGCRTD
jgi:hypothetical protein